MKTARGSHTIAGAFVFLLLGIFAVSATVMVLLGVRFYRAQTEKTRQTGEYRILSSYVRSMVRAQDEEKVVGCDQIDGIDMLTITENYDGWEYITRIYAWDGSLREWFSDAEYPFDPAQGEAICEAQDFHVKLEDGLVHASVTGKSGQTIETVIAIRTEPSGKAAGGADAGAAEEEMAGQTEEEARPERASETGKEERIGQTEEEARPERAGEGEYETE